MTNEAPENPFRERRSAHLDEDAAEQAVRESAASLDTEIRPPEEPPAPEPPAPESHAPEPPAREPADEEPAGPEDADLEDMVRMEVPEASFQEVVYEYAIRAQQFLGDAPITREGQRRVLPNYAKHMIDLLGILEERTRGNLTPEESQLLTQVLDDLRLRYVEVTS